MNVRDLIKKHEGLRLTPYRCSAGYRTIGWGHNLDAAGEPSPEIITVAQAEDYLEQDLDAATAGCYRVIPCFGSLDEVRRAALTDLCFNLGAAGLGKFRRMILCLQAEDWARAGAELIDSKWAVQVQRDRVLRIVRMILIGEWA